MSADSSSSSATACGPAKVCAPEVPDSWAGPVALRAAELGAQPGCAGNYADLVWDLDIGIDASGSCACSCGDPVGIVCDSVLIQRFDAPGCGGAPTDFPTAEGQCVPVTAQSMRVTKPITGGSCPAIATAQLSPATPTGSLRACGGALPGAPCETGSCVDAPAEPFSTGLCVWHSGDVECPPGYDGGERIVAFDGVVDDRDCEGACTCVLPETCTGDARGGDPTDCANGVELADYGVCFESTDVTELRGSQESAPALACTPGAPSVPPVGTVTGEAPVTFCCL